MSRIGSRAVGPDSRGRLGKRRFEAGSSQRSYYEGAAPGWVRVSRGEDWVRFGEGDGGWSWPGGDRSTAIGSFRQIPSGEIGFVFARGAGRDRLRLTRDAGLASGSDHDGSRVPSGDGTNPIKRPRPMSATERTQFRRDYPGGSTERTQIARRNELNRRGATERTQASRRNEPNSARRDGTNPNRATEQSQASRRNEPNSRDGTNPMGIPPAGIGLALRIGLVIIPATQGGV